MHRWFVGLIVSAVLASTGCALNLVKRSPWDVQQLEQLSGELETFRNLAHLKDDELARLKQAKGILDANLSGSQASVGYDERGLVARVLDSVLFDSGKATLQRSARPILDGIGEALWEVPEQPIGIEGYTDNQPIKRSRWISNQALSEARAQAVADYFIKRHNLAPRRLTVIGYGEGRPLATNKTVEGRQKNRRVEIVILPQRAAKSYQAEADRVARDAGYVK